MEDTARRTAIRAAVFVVVFALLLGLAALWLGMPSR